MGIDDRDYMRERYRQRQGLSSGGKFWGLGKGARQARADKARQSESVPLGSASWIDGKSRVEFTAPWFETKNRGFDYQNSRSRRTVQFKPHPLQKWVLLLSAVSILFPAYREMKRGGWLPDMAAAAPFPRSGSVTVNRRVEPGSAISKMRVTAGPANAVVQLFDPETDQHIISVYVRKHDDVTVPVPPGTYRMRLIEGDKWHGPVRFFGPSTTYESVARLMTFTRTRYSGIDLHRRPDGELKTRIKIGDPPPLR
ncbi:MAG: hypothetical protein WBL20_22300 [Sphingobium sp.]|jgi:hypothetical protein|uniref:hypothetical protein n=1 Tax=Sphingobium sp. TaxID=1912891 RepID=UPI003BB0A081